MHITTFVYRVGIHAHLKNAIAVLGVVSLIGLTSASARANPGIRTQEKPAPSYLHPSLNPLQVPTEPSSVRIQGTQPVTLQQAQELAGRNNHSLQVGQLTVERSRAAVREQQATVYPTLGVSGELTNFSGRL